MVPAPGTYIVYCYLEIVLLLKETLGVQRLRKTRPPRRAWIPELDSAVGPRGLSVASSPGLGPGHGAGCLGGALLRDSLLSSRSSPTDVPAGSEGPRGRFRGLPFLFLNVQTLRLFLLAGSSVVQMLTALRLRNSEAGAPLCALSQVTG